MAVGFHIVQDQVWYFPREGSAGYLVEASDDIQPEGFKIKCAYIGTQTVQPPNHDRAVIDGLNALPPVDGIDVQALYDSLGKLIADGYGASPVVIENYGDYVDVGEVDVDSTTGVVRICEA